MIGRLNKLGPSAIMPVAEAADERPFLEVKDLFVKFPTEDGLVHAVDGVEHSLGEDASYGSNELNALASVNSASEAAMNSLMMRYSRPRPDFSGMPTLK